ncbi:MAG TPA: hypothetical protein VIO39_07475 [Methylotenera sp.]
MVNRTFDDHPITLYSNLMEWLQKLSMRSASSAQWIATIISAKGIREEEIKRSGLLSFLCEFDGADKVLKERLLEVAEYGLYGCLFTVRTERSTTYRPELQSAAFAPDTIPQKVLDTFSDAEIVSCHKLVSFNYKVVKLRFTGMFGSGESWFVFDEHWHQFKPSQSYGNPVEAIDFLYTVAAEKFSEYSSHSPCNYYERYSLLGKNNRYREWLVCLPDWPESFEQSHFDLLNVILHLRTSEWEDANGEPLLLVDEMQSDWHAAGREHDYYPINADIDNDETAGVPDAPFKKEWYELGIKLAIWIALQSGHNRVAFTTGNIHKARYGQDLDGFHLLYDQLIPKALSKLVDKFKCSLDLANIEISKPTDTIRFKNGTGWELRKQGKNDDVQIIRNQVVAMRYLKGRGQKQEEELRVLEVSPELTELVKSKGLPLFGWW